MADGNTGTPVESDLDRPIFSAPHTTRRYADGLRMGLAADNLISHALRKLRNTSSASTGSRFPQPSVSGNDQGYPMVSTSRNRGGSSLSRVTLRVPTEGEICGCRWISATPSRVVASHLGRAVLANGVRFQTRHGKVSEALARAGQSEG